MVGFIIIVFVVIIIAIGSGKQKKQPKYQQRAPFKPAATARTNPSAAIKVPSIIVKTPILFLTEANNHFGWEWQAFLVKWSAKLSLSNQRIREEVAAAYAAMTTKERQDLFATYSINGLVDYQALHTGVYRLLLDRRFKQEYLLQFFRKLIRDAVPPNPVRPAQPNTMDNLQSILDAVNNMKITVGNSDPSIIEVSHEPLKIEYNDTNALPSQTINQPDHNLYQPIHQPYIQPHPDNNLYHYDPDDYKLGTLYKTKLNLSAQEVQWLNKFYYYSNTFNSIEGSGIAIIKLYLLSLKKMVRRFANETYTLSAITDDIGNAAVKQHKKQFGRMSAEDIKYVKNQAEGDLYYTLYKKAELAVRESWDHKRKISADFSMAVPEALAIFKKHLEPAMDTIVQELRPTIGTPDEETETQLNVATTTRWKIKFDEITAMQDGEAMTRAFYELGRLNRKNPAVENIYYEASKFLADKNKLESLRFYIHYIYEDLKSVKIDNKALNKTIQKKLFANEEQLNEFQAIIGELTKTQNLSPALDKVSEIYKPKRKKIVLDTDQIRSVRQQHSGTVDILNTYLQDEEEEVPLINTLPLTETINTTILGGQRTTAVPLNALQISCLELFEANSNTLRNEQLEDFAVSNAIFKNQLIDSINDSCNELLDDMLIEEDEDDYILNSSYLTRIYLS